MGDDKVIAAANQLGLAMVFTGVRHFRHQNQIPPRPDRAARVSKRFQFRIRLARVVQLFKPLPARIFKDRSGKEGLCSNALV